MVFAIKMSTSITSTIATPPQLAPGIYMGIHEFDFSLLAAIGRVFNYLCPLIAEFFQH